MSLQGPMIVVADSPARDLVDALAAAGAFPVVEANWAQAAEAIESVHPGAIVLAERTDAVATNVRAAIADKIATTSGAWIPVIARGEGAPLVFGALSVAANAPVSRFVARVVSALRVRALDATVVRRMAAIRKDGGKLPPLPLGDPLDDAAVLLLGRGSAYPALSVALGERIAVIGVLSVAAAARILGERDIDGVVIGDGFSARTVEAVITVLREDARFRDLPCAVIGASAGADPDGLPNFERHSDPALLIHHLLPLVRLHAMEARLKRVLASLDRCGLLDPATGLMTDEAFVHDLDRTIRDAHDRAVALCVARFAFGRSLEERVAKDVARLFARTVRTSDFACQEEDGSIVAVFPETELREAHVVARRSVAVLKHSMLVPTADQRADPTITLATLKPADTIATLMERVLGPAVFAAE